MRRWMDGGVFEVLVADVQSLLREFGNRKRQRTAVYLVTHPRESTPASGVRAGSDGAKRLKNSKVQIAVDRLGHLMAQKATPADRGDRAQVIALAEEVQLVTGDTVDLACVHRGAPARPHGRPLENPSYGSKSSNTPWQYSDSSCSPDGGSWN
jgi:hypothetical protein